MLVANIGQTAPYTALVAESTISGSNSSSASSSSIKSSTDNPMTTTSSISTGVNGNNSSNNKQQRIAVGSGGLQNFSFGLMKNVVYATPSSLTAKTSTLTSTIGTRSYLQTYTSAPANMLKSLTVHLNRGTETLKSTMQKALFSAVSARNKADTKSYDNKNDDIHGNKTLTKNPGLAHNCKLVDSRIVKASTIVSANNFVTSAKTEGEIRKIDNSLERRSLGRENLFRVAVNYLPITSNNSVNSVPPTQLHRSPHEYKRQQTGSVDSLHKEMCHFKPICSAPCTPWKSGNRLESNLILCPKVQKIDNSLENEGENTTPKITGSMGGDDMKELPKPKSSALSQSLLRRQRLLPNRRRYRSAFVLLKELNSVSKMNSLIDVNNTSSDCIRRNTRSRMAVAGKSNSCMDVQSTPTRSRLHKTASKSKTMLVEVTDSNSSQTVNKAILPSIANLNNSRKSCVNTCINFKPKIKKSKFCVASNRDMRRLRNYVHFADDEMLNTHIDNPIKYNNRNGMVFDFVENCPDDEVVEIPNRIPWNGKKLANSKSCMLNIVQLAKDTNAALKKATIIPEQSTSQHILAVTKPLTRKEACQSAIPIKRRGRKRASSYLRHQSAPIDPKDDLVADTYAGYKKMMRRTKVAANKNLNADKKPVNEICNHTNPLPKTKSIKSFANIKPTNTNSTKRKRMASSISSCNYGQNMKVNRLKELATSKRIKDSSMNTIQSKIYATNCPLTRLQYRKMFTREISPPIFSIDKLPYL